MKRRHLSAAFAAAIVIAIASVSIAWAQTAGSTVIRDPQVKDICTATTDNLGYFECDVPTGTEVGLGLEGHEIATVDAILVGPRGGQRNLPSANLYKVSVNQATGVILFRDIGTEIIRWAHDGHWGPIPYANGSITVELIVFYAED